MRKVEIIEEKILYIKRKILETNDWINRSKYTVSLSGKIQEKIIQLDDDNRQLENLLKELDLIQKSNLNQQDEASIFMYNMRAIFAIYYSGLYTAYENFISLKIDNIVELNECEKIINNWLLLLEKNLPYSLGEKSIRDLELEKNSEQGIDEVFESVFLHGIKKDGRFTSFYFNGYSCTLNEVSFNNDNDPTEIKKIYHSPSNSNNYINNVIEFIKKRGAVVYVYRDNDQISERFFGIIQRFKLLQKRIQKWRNIQKEKFAKSQQDLYFTSTFIDGSKSSVKINKNGVLFLMGVKFSGKCIEITKKFNPLVFSSVNSNWCEYIKQVIKDVNDVFQSTKKNTKMYRTAHLLLQEKQVDRLADKQKEVNEQCKIYWNNIDFNDGFFRFSYKGVYWKVNNSRSMRCFNYLKHHLYSFNTSSIEVILTFSNIPVVNVVNSTVIEQVFSFLEIEQILNNEDVEDSNYFSKVFSGGWTNEKLLKAYMPERRTLYLKYLCEEYSAMFYIVPVREKRQHESNNTIIQEDAFLFPIYGRKHVYILWESVEEKRATYVFRCQSVNYASAIQKVFDYIASPAITNKRDRLRQGNVSYFKESTVEYWQSVNHNDLEDWKRRLNEACW